MLQAVPTTESAPFRYSDGDDAITRAYIDGASHQAYWEASERRIMASIRERLAAFSIRTFADLGCGDGRLYPHYSSNALDAVFLVEPDWERLENSAQQTLGSGGRVKFARIQIQDFIPPSPLDGVLCSHVIQHMTESDALRVLHQIGRAILRPGGHLFLMTSYTPREEDTFSVAWVENERLKGEDLSREAFESRFRQTNQGVLLNHAFSRGTIERLLKLAGFEVMETKAFHLECSEPTPVEELLRLEDEINHREAVEQCPADLFVHARQTSRPE